MESCGLKDRKNFRKSYIVPGLIDHAIELKYPNEPNHPRRMYRLTKQALEWKKSREDLSNYRLKVATGHLQTYKRV